jgi:hypothetical protein
MKLPQHKEYNRYRTWNFPNFLFSLRASQSCSEAYFGTRPHREKINVPRFHQSVHNRKDADGAKPLLIRLKIVVHDLAKYLISQRIDSHGFIQILVYLFAESLK